MDRRFVLFLVLSFAILLGYSALTQHLFPRRPLPPQAAGAAKEPAKAEPEKPKAKRAPEGPGEKPGVKPAEKPEKAPPAIQAPPEPELPEKYVTLGSADPDPAKNPYRMLVTLTTKGAALARIELSSPHYCDVDNRYGYLGHLVMAADAKLHGGLVQVVGPGTPAAEAGLRPGDLLKAVDREPVSDPQSLEDVLKRTRPEQSVRLAVVRDGKEATLTAALRRRPLEVIRPEGDDPLSLLLTLAQVGELKLQTQWARDVAIWHLVTGLKATEQQIAELDLTDVVLNKDEQKIHLPQEARHEKQWVPLSDEAAKALDKWQTLRGEKGDPLFFCLPEGATQVRLSHDEIRRIVARVHDEEQGQGQPGLFAELEGVNLRRGTWKLVRGEPDRAVFRRALPRWGLEITKTYRLAEVPKESRADADFPAYHLEFEIEIRNTGSQAHKVAYRLDGPNGLPMEGAWYASKVSRNWGGSGLRDFVISFGGGTPGMVNTTTIAGGKDLDVWPDTPPDKMLTFIGVDAQYFSAVLMPERPSPAQVWFEELTPICVGKVDPKQTRFANASCRLTSVTASLEPRETLRHRFKLFAGPKRPALLENNAYRLGELVYYGWPIFAAVAVPLTKILHVFYAVTWNYGLAIILLTVLVRGCMFPLSLKQAAGAGRCNSCSRRSRSFRRSTRTTSRPAPRPSRSCSRNTTTTRWPAACRSSFRCPCSWGCTAA